ncbi:hypothetical protein [Pseudomonas schmalbachii]|uniref:DUF2970 domain-containing protein n=1 Tax=Pseudomonas schmalbachii TaxID=2816993 RepID=A0ABS3TKA9_9PSED|nr:hypothetical protein [Pseudomonas schmalbachii]MBO3274072.1 hypothetical protein [Pseudomonas schmalbachii]
MAPAEVIKMHLLGSEDRQSLRSIAILLMGFLVIVGVLIAVAVVVG